MWHRSWVGSFPIGSVARVAAEANWDHEISSEAAVLSHGNKHVLMIRPYVELHGTQEINPSFVISNAFGNAVFLFWAKKWI